MFEKLAYFNDHCNQRTYHYFLKTAMCDFPNVPISDFENTLSFPGEETSLGSGLPSHPPSDDIPCPSSPSHGFLHHLIGTLSGTLIFLLSRFEHAYDLEIPFEKIFNFDINIGITSL
jgi:hypothetical protein